MSRPTGGAAVMTLVREGDEGHGEGGGERVARRDGAEGAVGHDDQAEDGRDRHGGAQPAAAPGREGEAAPTIADWRAESPKPSSRATPKPAAMPDEDRGHEPPLPAAASGSGIGHGVTLAIRRPAGGACGPGVCRRVRGRDTLESSCANTSTTTRPWTSTTSPRTATPRPATSSSRSGMPCGGSRACRPSSRTSPRSSTGRCASSGSCWRACGPRAPCATPSAASRSSPGWPRRPAPRCSRASSSAGTPRTRRRTSAPARPASCATSSWRPAPTPSSATAS